ncbi:protein Niban 2b [Polypterus senegalus]|uniref:protein Niban 2b n=1 Tax=Polypterus senegalus TaxID=55291 RepID=UPI001966751D|nr:protein Niban 2b [Polypterus senegalus]
MGDVISTHLDDQRRQYIAEKTGKIVGEFCKYYEQQYGVALFNKVRCDIEGVGAPQSQLLQRKVPLADKCIFSGNLFQYLEENRKWRNRYLFVPDSYSVHYYETKLAWDRGLHPKGIINCAGYKVLTSVEQYLELLNNCLPGLKVKASSSPYLKCATQFPIILWHPYARHFYFCVMSEKEQKKWQAVFQDCVRHTNNGLPEDDKVKTPAFTDAVRLYRQAKDQYGTWDMMCGNAEQILTNLVMEELHPELRNLISPRLKGKVQERQKHWILISDAVYRLVQTQTEAQYDAVLQRCELGRPQMESMIRTDMDQITASKEHICNKIRATVLPKAELCVRNHVQPYISSILDALMSPTSRGFFEVRDIFFRELLELNKNVVNEGGQDKLGEYMEKITMLAYHPVKMHSCYEKMEELQLEGLQQRFDVSSPAVFIQRAQILMREQMDNAVYTFEQLLHQSLESTQEKDELCKLIQRIQERVIKKYDYDSSTVRKKFFREALLQIIIPYLLKKLSPTCRQELPKYQEFIYEDYAKFILLENLFEEVVLQSVMKDIMLAVKEAAVQRKHNLFRDSIVLTNSDPNLHLLGEGPPIDWGGEFPIGSTEPDAPASEKRRRMKQVVSMIQDEGAVQLPNESCMEVPAEKVIPEEQEGEVQNTGPKATEQEDPKSPDSVHEIRDLINPKITVENTVPAGDLSLLNNGTVTQEAQQAASVKKEECQEIPSTHSTSQLSSTHLDNGCQSPASKENEPNPAHLVTSDISSSPAKDATVNASGDRKTREEDSVN